jgi:Ragulator complex protein LAMTOR5
MSSVATNNGGSHQPQQQQRLSQPESLFDSIVLGDRQGVGGLLCNDPSGLCLAADGAMDAKDAGTYTSLVRLASQLQAAGSRTSSSSSRYVAPLITIETGSAAILVKEYDGHAVAIRVPRTASTEEATAVEEAS